MKYILTSETLDIPSDVTVNIKNKVVEVKGPLGSLKKSFKHVPIDLQKKIVKGKGSSVVLNKWLSGKKQKSVVSTIKTQIANMFRGVKRGYKYRMRFAYAHFPIQAFPNKDKKGVEIKNFLGEKYVRKIKALDGVEITTKDEAKDELEVRGIDLENTSLTCALIGQSVKVRNKDIRQFLDGIYVSEKRLDFAE